MNRARSVHERVATARRRLREAGIGPDEADLDARLLAQHVLGWDAARFLSTATDHEPPEFDVAYERVVARRERREPLAYIVGAREFWHRSFLVSPAVLVPRPETELIVEAALERLAGQALVADVGTGSGCLAVTLAAERPNVTVVALDRSLAALHVAGGNATRHRVASRVYLAQTDLLMGVKGLFDLIVSNPPYVPDADAPGLMPEVRDHEPASALLGGPDGLTLIRRLVVEASGRLTPTGALIFEFGAGQAADVADLISGADGLRMMALRRDLQGIPRVAIAGKQGSSGASQG